MSGLPPLPPGVSYNDRKRLPSDTRNMPGRRVIRTPGMGTLQSHDWFAEEQWALYEEQARAQRPPPRGRFADLDFAQLEAEQKALRRSTETPPLRPLRPAVAPPLIDGMDASQREALRKYNDYNRTRGLPMDEAKTVPLPQTIFGAPRSTPTGPEQTLLENEEKLASLRRAHPLTRGRSLLHGRLGATNQLPYDEPFFPWDCKDCLYTNTEREFRACCEMCALPRTKEELEEAKLMPLAKPSDHPTLAPKHATMLHPEPNLTKIDPLTIRKTAKLTVGESPIFSDLKEYLHEQKAADINLQASRKRAKPGMTPQEVKESDIDQAFAHMQENDSRVAAAGWMVFRAPPGHVMAGREYYYKEGETRWEKPFHKRAKLIEDYDDFAQAAERMDRYERRHFNPPPSPPPVPTAWRLPSSSSSSSASYVRSDLWRELGMDEEGEG